MVKEIEIFRAGTRPDANGVERTITTEELRQVVDSYDPGHFKAPLIVSHNTGNYSDHDIVHSELAFGFPKALKLVGDRLKGVFDKISPKFVEWVRNGEILSISSSFYLPDSPTNPYPGKWSLRHIAGLGKSPPAVKGMEPLTLSEIPHTKNWAFSGAEFKLPAYDEGAIEFSQFGVLLDPFVLENIVDTFTGIRDYLIQTIGLEATEKVMPRDRLSAVRNGTQGGGQLFATSEDIKALYEMLSDEGEDEDEDEDGAGAVKSKLFSYSEGAQVTSSENKESTQEGGAEMTVETVDMNEFEDLKRRLAEAEAEKIRLIAERRKAEVTSFVEKLTSGNAARLTMAQTQPIAISFGEETGEMDLVNFLCSLNQEQAAFAEEFLSNLPAQVSYGELTAQATQPTAEATGPLDYTEIGLAARQLVAESRKSGVQLTEAQAVDKVIRERGVKLPA